MQIVKAIVSIIVAAVLAVLVVAGTERIVKKLKTNTSEEIYNAPKCRITLYTQNGNFIRRWNNIPSNRVFEHDGNTKFYEPLNEQETVVYGIIVVEPQPVDTSYRAP